VRGQPFASSGAPSPSRRQLLAEKTALPCRIQNEAPIIEARSAPLGAAMRRVEVVLMPIQPIGMNQVAAGSIDEIAEPVDLTFDDRIRIDDGVAQVISRDEVFRQLVERTVERGVQLRIGFKHADQNLSCQLMVAIERKGGTLADYDTIGASG